jgi:hypothetical protein
MHHLNLYMANKAAGTNFFDVLTVRTAQVEVDSFRRLL